MTRLYLVRHAQAAEPGDLRLPGPDLSLTEQGRHQAEALGRRVRRHRPSAIYASDSARARETAEAIVREGFHRDLAVTVDPDLREVNFGDWGGMTYSEVVEEQPLAAAYFTDPCCATPPGGEPGLSVANRVVGALQRIALAHLADAVMIVGHAGSLRLALATVLGIPLRNYWRFRMDCAALSIVEWSDDGPIVESWNDVSHLVEDWNTE